MLHLNMGDQIRNHELWLDYSHGRIIYIYIYRLVVSTPRKNISQWTGLSHILWKLNKCLKTTNQYINGLKL